MNQRDTYLDFFKSIALINMFLYHFNFYLKSNFQLLVASILVSMGSYLTFPDKWIFFGVLHFILVSKFLLSPLVKYPKHVLFLGLSILLVYFIIESGNPFWNLP